MKKYMFFLGGHDAEILIDGQNILAIGALCVCSG